VTVLEFNLSRPILMDSPGNPEAVRADYQRQARRLRTLLDRIDAHPADAGPDALRALADETGRLWESLNCAAARASALHEMYMYLTSLTADEP
jgi:hypothetical protein